MSAWCYQRINSSRTAHAMLCLCIARNDSNPMNLPRDNKNQPHWYRSHSDAGYYCYLKHQSSILPMRCTLERGLEALDIESKWVPRVDVCELEQCPWQRKLEYVKYIESMRAGWVGWRSDQGKVYHHTAVTTLTRLTTRK